MRLRTVRRFFWNTDAPWATMRDFLVPHLLRIVHASILSTLRITTSGVASGRPYVERENTGPGALFIAWHDVMWLPLYLFQHQDISAIVSHSRSGQMAAAICDLYGWPVIWGSRGKREGITALRAARERLRGGQSVSFTPDGPLGPRHQAQPGIVYLASTTPAIVMPLGVATEKGWQLPTWDKFLIPRPFSRVHVHLGKPLHIPPEAAREDIEAWQQRVNKAMEEAVATAWQQLKERT